MIRHAKQTWRDRANELLLLVALLVSPCLLRYMSPAVLHAQSNGPTNELDFTDPVEISAGAPGLKVTIYGTFPINKGIQTPICFYTVPGTSGTPLIPAGGDSRSSTLVSLTIPAGSIQEIPASAFVGGVFKATAYATANSTDTCNGTSDPTYTTTLQIPIQEPVVQSTDLDTLTARNTSLGGNPAPREIYLQGTDFVKGEATVSFSGKTFDPFAGVVTVVSSISARVAVPTKFPASAKSVALTFCTHTALADYCASPVTYPIQPLDKNPGTLTATPSPTAPTTPTSLQAAFGSTDGFGVPSGLVTFTDGTTTLGTAPLALTNGQFVATNPPSAAAGDFEGPPQSILADLNQDGLQDVILYAPNTVQIYYAADNLGAFGFVTNKVGFSGVEFALDRDFCLNVVSVTTGDFNNDGYPDIAMLCTDPSGTTDNVLVYLNQQDGTFGRESAITSAPSAHLIAAADFNHDGNTDILLVGPDGNTNLDGSALLGFTIYQGDGLGDFGGATTTDVPLGDGYQVAALDFNNDGFPDIALLYHDFHSDLSTSQIEVFQNDGTGNFPATATYSRSLGDTGATFQFFTPTLPGSKYPNLVAVNGGIDSGIGLVFNNQTPAIGFSDTLYTTPVPGLLSATMGDFNGDGFQDVAVYDGTNVSVYNADTLGQYIQPLASFTMPGGSVDMLLGSSDANGDGYSDPIAFITPSDGARLVQQYITSGTATATLDNLTFAAGSHSLTATTPGTPTISPGSASATLMSNVTEVNVSNAVLTTSPASPTTYTPSNPVTLTVEVDSLTAPAPTGLIRFFNSATNALLGTMSLTPTSGTQSFASLPIGTQTVGDYLYSATYSGDTNYFGATIGAVAFQVNQATPVVGFIPNPATITFGTALSAAQLDATATLGGSAVAGGFAYTNASGTAVDTTTVLPGGNNNITATFTPADTTDYKKPVGVTSTIMVNRATPTVSWTAPAAVPYGTALSATQLNATATFNGKAVAGTFSYSPAAGTVLTAGTQTLGVTFTAADATDFAVATGSTSIAVGQSTPVITWAPPAAINLGTALSATQLNASATGVGGAALPGTFTYLPAAGAVLPVGANSLGLTFTPTDAVDYKTTAASVPLTVNPALTTTTVTSSGNPAQFGQLVTFAVGVTSAYSGAAITGPVSVFDGATLLGTVQLPNVTVSTSTLSAGTHNITAAYGGSTNFGGNTSSILAQTISSATTVITWPQPASVPYGTKLSATQLNATASTAFAQTVPGTFTYTPAAGALLTAGSQTLSVVFTPTDTASFKTATATVTLAVTKVAPTLNWAAPANITAGTRLGAGQLNATATDIARNPLPGVFTYTPAGGTILAPGATTLSASFAPTDTVDYTPASISVPLNVDPAVATIAVTSTANPSQFGQPVTFNVNITSAYTASPISGTVTISDGKTVLATPVLTNGAASFATSTLTAGAHNVTASFAGNPTFAAATSTALAQIVNLATTTITWPTPAGITYGTALSATQLNATVATPYAATVPGTFVYTPAAGTVLNAGTQTLSVTFTPTDTVNFKPATGSVAIVIGKIAPAITWPTPADVVAGTTLSATQLNATAAGVSGALPGTFAYTPAPGTVLTAGTQTLNVTFTPRDLTDYTTATASVPLNVIGLALTSLSTAGAKLGDPALNLTVTGTGFLPNSVAYVGTTALTTTFLNPTSLTVTVPASNFLTAQILQITVNDPTQAQTSNALAIVVGAPPAAISVNGPPTVTPAAQPNLTFTINPYAVPIAATLTLTFTPAPGLTTDGTILFPNGTTTTTFTIPANTTTIPPVQFQSGSVAGTIIVTLKLTAGGVDVTPTPAPTLVITSPAAAPGVEGVTLDRSGDTLTVTIQGYSNTRDIEQIHFHFVAAPGQSLATSDLVIDGSALFSAWYSDPASPTYGSTFHYIQLFNLDRDSTVVGQVQVTLVNSQGNSQTVSAQ